MMLRRFTEISGDAPPPDLPRSADPKGLRAVCGGLMLGGGLYRILGDDRMARLQDPIRAAFPGLANEADLFATDWLGRAFGFRAG